MCSFRITSDTKSFKCVTALNKIPIYRIYDKGDIRSKKRGKVYDEYGVYVCGKEIYENKTTTTKAYLYAVYVYGIEIYEIKSTTPKAYLYAVYVYGKEIYENKSTPT